MVNTIPSLLLAAPITHPTQLTTVFEMEQNIPGQ
jgi:hypothetical protein